MKCPLKKSLSAVDHPLIKDGEAPDIPLDNAVLNRLKQFRAMNKFKKVALRVSPKTLISLSISVSEIFCVWVLKVIAGCLSEEEIQGLKEMFKAIDTDNSGSTTMEELRQGLCKQGTKLSEYEVKQLLEAVSSLETLLSSSRVLLLRWFFFIIRERERAGERVMRTINTVTYPE